MSHIALHMETFIFKHMSTISTKNACGRECWKEIEWHKGAGMRKMILELAIERMQKE